MAPTNAIFRLRYAATGIGESRKEAAFPKSKQVQIQVSSSIHNVDS